MLESTPKKEGKKAPKNGKSWLNFGKVLARICQVHCKYLIIESNLKPGHLTFNQVVAGSIPARPTNKANKNRHL